MIDKMCRMDYAEDMMCVVERRNPNNVVTLSHGFPGYHDLCNIVTISATHHITLLFSREFGDVVSGGCEMDEDRGATVSEWEEGIA